MLKGFFWSLALLTFSAEVVRAETVRFLPQWIPQAQFAGYYMALHAGIYEKYGLQVEILEGGPSAPPDKALLWERADAVTLWLVQGISMREKGVALVNIAQIIQGSSLLLIGRKGLDGLDSLQGKRISLWEGLFSVPFHVLFQRQGLAVQILPQGTGMNLFLRGLVHAASAMWYNEYHTLLVSGFDAEDFVVFPLRDFGFDIPEDGIYVMEKRYRERPHVWKAFVEASLEGWRYAFSHSEETLDVILKKLSEAGYPASRSHQRWMLHCLRDLMLFDAPGSKAGKLTRQSYETAVQALQEMHMIHDVPSYDEFYRGHVDP